ncbi:MAG: VWA domain-containing protein [Sedimenticola sp.]
MRPIYPITATYKHPFFVFSCTECNLTLPVDVVFVLDASGSVGSQNFQTMLTFVNKVVDGFPVNQNETHIGLVTFSSGAHLQFYLNQYFDKAAIKQAVSQTRFSSYSIYTRDVLWPRG